MGFDAGGTIEPLDWDFSTIPNGPPALKNASGTIREPSDQMIGKFIDAQKALFTEASKKYEKVAELGDDPDAGDVMRALNDLSGDDVVKLLADTAGLYADLCSGSPTADQILALPLRARIAFFSWLDGEVVRPEAGSGGGNAQVVRLSTAARG